MAKGIPFDLEAYYTQNASPVKRDYLLEELRKAKVRAPETYNLQLRNRVEARYRRLINALLKEAEKRTAGMTDPAEIIRTLNNLTYSPEFARMCEAAARNSITMLAAGQKQAWQAAATASGRGKAIYKALSKELSSSSAVGQAVEQIVQENAKLIKTVPQSMAAKLSELSKQRYAEGLRPEAITKEIMKKQTGLREFEARRIARTESSKASTALAQSRAEAIGLDFYIWRTAKDGDRVRKSHQLMEGVVCRWSEPPDPEAMAGEKSYGAYHPGCIFNCRCWAWVIVSLSDISFPCKVHKGGAIHTVRDLEAFKQMFGLAAA